MPPVICPRSAILQSAAASMADGILVVTVSTAERIATHGVRKQIDDILNDIALDVEIGKNIDRNVGNEDGFAIGRYIHDEPSASNRDPGG